jgi:polyhydroxyalkanoate synthase
MAKRPTKASPGPKRRRRAAQGRSPDLGQAAASPREEGRGARSAGPEPPPLPPNRRPPKPSRSRTPAASEAANPFVMPGADQMQALETLSMNIARAAMTAQSAIAEAALSQADRPAALSPDPFNVGPAMTSVMTSLAARPDKLFSAQADLFNRYMDLWASTTRRAAGETRPLDRRPDKRFKDPAWSENPMFDMMRQSYLVTSDWMNGLIASVEDVDPMTRAGPSSSPSC